ncbi:MAG: hypothetical protein AAGM21_01775 [Pseudomonadota bacterium]
MSGLQQLRTPFIMTQILKRMAAKAAEVVIETVILIAFLAAWHVFAENSSLLEAFLKAIEGVAKS